MGEFQPVQGDGSAAILGRGLFGQEVDLRHEVRGAELHAAHTSGVLLHLGDLGEGEPQHEIVVCHQNHITRRTSCTSCISCIRCINSIITGTIFLRKELHCHQFVAVGQLGGYDGLVVGLEF